MEEIQTIIGKKYYNYIKDENKMTIDTGFLPGNQNCSSKTTFREKIKQKIEALKEKVIKDIGEMRRLVDEQKQIYTYHLKTKKPKKIFKIGKVPKNSLNANEARISDDEKNDDTHERYDLEEATKNFNVENFFTQNTDSKYSDKDDNDLDCFKKSRRKNSNNFDLAKKIFINPESTFPISVNPISSKMNFDSQDSSIRNCEQDYKSTTLFTETELNEFNGIQNEMKKINERANEIFTMKEEPCNQSSDEEGNLKRLYLFSSLTFIFL